MTESSNDPNSPTISVTDSSKIPTLYRYIDQNFVDDFFDNGNLYFTTIYNCRSHEDLIRKDETEGKAVFKALPDVNGDAFDKSHKHRISLSKEGRDPQSMVAKVEFGFPNSFLLCLSSRGDNFTMRRFQTDSLFAITDMMGFIHAIKDAFEDYFKTRNTTLNGAPISGQVLYTDCDDMPYDLLDSGDHTILRKPTKYFPENEWRICVVPKQGIQLTPQVLKIKNPEDYCERVDVDKLS